MRCIVIGIHGIGNKPSPRLLSKWWEKSIYEGLKKHNYRSQKFKFVMVYWANLLHKTPLDPKVTDRDDPAFMNEKYLPESQPIIEPTGFRQKAIEYLENYYDKLIVKGILSLDNKKLTELFIHRHMKDLESYYSPKYIEVNGKKLLARDAIIERLADTLWKHRKKKIFLVAHSMGSIITHDALIKNIPEVKIDTLVSIGSPLGQRYIIDVYQKELKETSLNKFIVPECIKNGWYNLADLEDQVAINHTLSKIYVNNSAGLGISDKIVRNNYRYNGLNNPHKSFGYLRTPEFSQILSSFLAREERGFITWINKLLKKKI